MFRYSYLNNGVGIWVGRADAINIFNVNVIGYETGILLKTISTSYPSGVNITNCNVEGQIYCILAEGISNQSAYVTRFYSLKPHRLAALAAKTRFVLLETPRTPTG